MPLRTLASRSCNVRLFIMKNFSDTLVIGELCLDVAFACAGIPTIVDSRGSLDTKPAITGASVSAGEMTLAALLAPEVLPDPLRNRQTSLTPWNRES